MMKPIITTATMMAETAVVLVLIRITVQNVHVLVKILAIGFLIRLLEMVTVMRKPTLQTANMMVETAVQHPIWLEMASAMMKLILQPVYLMVVTAVYRVQTQISVLNVVVLPLVSSHHLDFLETMPIILMYPG